MGVTRKQLFKEGFNYLHPKGMRISRPELSKALIYKIDQSVSLILERKVIIVSLSDKDEMILTKYRVPIMPIKEVKNLSDLREMVKWIMENKERLRDVAV